MLLNASKIKNAKPNDRDQYLKDGNNLWLLIKPNGSKLWRYKRTINGKQIMRSGPGNLYKPLGGNSASVASFK
jgi:hypothetical protein